MAKEKVGEIRISKRIVRIGHEVYPLANISRVQTLRVLWRGKLATFYPLREIVVVLLLAGGVFAVAEVVLPELDPGFELEEAARQFAAGALVLAGIRIAFLMAVLLHRLLIRRQRYALVIETAGTQFTALSGTDHEEIHRIKGEIVGAIEDPPPFEKLVEIHGDLVVGDKVGRDKNQHSGTGNNMTFNR